MNRAGPCSLTLIVILIGCSALLMLDRFNIWLGDAKLRADELIRDVIRYGNAAQEYLVKPIELGGGGGTFQGLTLARLGADRDTRGVYSLAHISPHEIIISATAPDLQGENGKPVMCVARVTSTSIDTSVQL